MLDRVLAVQAPIRRHERRAEQDAVPDHRHMLDGPTLYPFLTAMAAGIGIITAIFTPWGITVGVVLTLPPLIGWFWPAGEAIAGTTREKA